MDSLSKYLAVLSILEHNVKYRNQNPYCEPQLGKRGLYRAIGAQSLDRTVELAMLWVLNLSDGCHSLLDIAERAGLEFEPIKKAAEALEEHGLLKSVS